MKFIIIQVGKTNQHYLSEGIKDYHKRIERLIPLEVITVPESGKNPKNADDFIKKEEAEKIRKIIKQGDIIVVLDENGKEMSSRKLAGFIQTTMNRGPKRIVFIIGGAWGMDNALKKEADILLSLSQMTFSHQLVRLLFAEQLYRALTIIKGTAYHHD